MRPAGRGEYDSLYFDYPRFGPPSRDLASQGEEHPVVIAGGGPVGMVAALALATHGVGCLLLDRKATFNDGSRAICIARQSFHILERIGAIQPFLDKALGWTTGRSFYRGRQILEFAMPHSEQEKFLPMYNLQQQYIEQYLWQAVERSPLIDMRWRSEVMAVADRPAGVGVSVRDPNGDYEIEAEWLLAADGARSPIRSMRNLRLRGENYEGRYVIVDVQMDHDYPTIRRALFDPPSNPGGTVLIHRQPDNIWRIDYQLREGESAEEATREAVVRDKVAAILADIGHRGDWKLEWWSVYSANTLALDDYRDGRIFFIGDSAHIVPIFGVRGLNNGLADAENIGWKLARVMKGEAGASLLDSYTPERRGATLDVFANATKSTRFMTPPTQGWRLMRDAALSLSLGQEFARPFANPRQMAPYTYAGSPVTTPDDGDFSGGPVPGAVVANVRLGNGKFLSDQLGRGYTGIFFAGPGGWDAPPDWLGRAMKSLDREFRLLTIGDVGAASETRLADPGGGIAERFGAEAGTFYLVRPDMHVAARRRAADRESIIACIERLLGKEAREDVDAL